MKKTYKISERCGVCGESRHPRCEECGLMACIKFFAVYNEKGFIRRTPVAGIGYKYCKDCWDKKLKFAAVNGESFPSIIISSEKLASNSRGIQHQQNNLVQKHRNDILKYLNDLNDINSDLKEIQNEVTSIKKNWWKKLFG